MIVNENIFLPNIIEKIKEAETGVITASNMLNAVYVDAIDSWVEDCKTEDKNGNPLIVLGQEFFWLLDCNSKKINEDILQALRKNGFRGDILKSNIFNQKKLYDFIMDIPVVVIFEPKKQCYKVVRASNVEANDGFWFFRDSHLIYKSQQAANTVSRIVNDVKELEREIECFFRYIEVFKMMEMDYPQEVQQSIKNVANDFSNIIWGGYKKELNKIIKSFQ